MAQPWHPYVFDTGAREFVGAFEDMYRAEAEGGFDSWHQSDPRRLDSQVSLLLADQVTIGTAVDIGCGKGSFTAQLKRRDNHVVGVDLSPTAIERARGFFPDIEWVCAPARDYLGSCERVDLVLLREVLSYLEDWRETLALASRVARHCIVQLYLPPDPIGFVPTAAELEAEFGRHFEVLESVTLGRRGISVHLGRSA